MTLRTLLRTVENVPLCFHILTNSFSPNSFPLITIQIAGGYTPLALQLTEPNSLSIHYRSADRESAADGRIGHSTTSFTLSRPVADEGPLRHFPCPFA